MRENIIAPKPFSLEVIRDITDSAVYQKISHEREINPKLENQLLEMVTITILDLVSELVGEDSFLKMLDLGVDKNKTNSVLVEQMKLVLLRDDNLVTLKNKLDDLFTQIARNLN